MTTTPLKHHYVPRFYLKAWAGPDGKVCEFSRPHRAVVARRVHPAATGHQERLYSMTGFPDALAQGLETDVFGPIDGAASRVHAKMLARRAIDGLSIEDRLQWSTFLNSMLMRSPADLTTVRGAWIDKLLDGDADYERRFEESRPEGETISLRELAGAFTRVELERDALTQLGRIVTSPRMAAALASIHWRIVDLGSATNTLLTSDFPVVRTNGLMVEDGHVVVPISPSLLFVACSAVRTTEKILGLAPNELVGRINDQVVSAALQRVFGVDDRQARFVSNRLSRNLAVRLTETILIPEV